MVDESFFFLWKPVGGREPAGPRRSQEEPGGARRSQEAYFPLLLLVFRWFPMVRWRGIHVIKQNGKFHKVV